MKNVLHSGKGAIFDLDGTLLDSLEDLAASGNYVLGEFGFAPLPLEGFRYYVGNGFRNMIRRAVAASLQSSPREIEIKDALISEMVLGVNKHYKDNWHNKTRPYAGIEALLHSLQARHIPFAVCSNKADAFVQEMLHYYFPGIFFAGAMGQHDEVPLKPDPHGALLLAERMGLRPQEIVFIGDTKVDMQTALGAGMFPVGVSWGFRPREELLENGAKLIVNKPDEILLCFG